MQILHFAHQSIQISLTQFSLFNFSVSGLVEIVLKMAHAVKVISFSFFIFVQNNDDIGL